MGVSWELFDDLLNSYSLRQQPRDRTVFRMESLCLLTSVTPCPIGDISEPESIPSLRWDHSVQWSLPGSPGIWGQVVGWPDGSVPGRSRAHWDTPERFPRPDRQIGDFSKIDLML